jgi:hypothetical protein
MPDKPFHNFWQNTMSRRGTIRLVYGCATEIEIDKINISNHTECCVNTDNAPSIDTGPCCVNTGPGEAQEEARAGSPGQAAEEGRQAACTPSSLQLSALTVGNPRVSNLT